MTIFQYLTKSGLCIQAEFQPCAEGSGLSQGLLTKATLTLCPQMLVPLLLQYLETLSGLVDSNLNCGPVLTWMEVGPGRGSWSRE